MRPLILLLLICYGHGLIAQDKSDPIISSQIDQQIWEPFKEAYANNNGPLYTGLHTEDILRITTGGGIKQNPAFTNDHLKRFAKKDRKPIIIDFRFEHRIHTDSIAYEVGYYMVSGVGKDQNPWENYGRFHVLLKKKNGVWKIAQDWDTGNVNGVAVTAKDFNRLDSLDRERQNLLHGLSLKRQKPHVLKKDGKAIFQYWEFENHPALWDKHIGTVPALQAYKDTLKQTLGQAEFWGTIEKERTQVPLTEIKKTKDTLDNNELVHQGGLGIIRPITFIEAEILNYQLERYPLFSHPTEFHGFIAQHDSLDLVRIYFAASDQPWPPKPHIVIDHLKESLNKGWKLTKHLHNHYCEEDKNYLGINAPSKADAHYFKMLRDDFQVQETLITNGFTTVVLKPSEFDRFNSH